MAMTNSQARPADRSKSEASRVRILDAAARTFAQKGYAATTLNEIAEAAGMRAGSLYYHFESKEVLLEEVMEIGIRRVSDAVRERLESMPADARFEDRLRAAVEAHLALLLRHGDYTAANIRIFGQLPEDVQGRQRGLRKAYDDYWRGLLESGRRGGAIRADADLRLARMLLLGALNGSAEWYRPGGKTIAAIAEETCALLLRGMGAEARTPPRLNDPARPGGASR